MAFIEEHLKAFEAAKHEPQGAVGFAPRAWALRHQCPEFPQFEQLPDHKLTRAEVRKYCQNPNFSPMFGYVCAMAWGGQGAGPFAKHAREALLHINNRLDRLEKLRGPRSAVSEELDRIRAAAYSREPVQFARERAYNAWVGENLIPGLGPSFLTKLLFFFSPERNHYIMDKWTSRSVNLLTGAKIVNIGASSPSSANTSTNYEIFCEAVDALSRRLGISGEHVEERLFSVGGRPNKKGPWRTYTEAHWPPDYRIKKLTSESMEALRDEFRQTGRMVKARVVLREGPGQPSEAEEEQPDMAAAEESAPAAIRASQEESPAMPGLSAISIENFKGISTRVEIPLKPITLFFGANSAGKSTVIQAIHYARELLERNNADADVPRAGGNAIDLGGFRNMVHGHDLSRKIRIGFDLNPPEDGIPNLHTLSGVPPELTVWNSEEEASFWDISRFVSLIRVELESSFDLNHRTPWFSQLAIFVSKTNDAKAVSTEPLCTLHQDGPGSQVYLKVRELADHFDETGDREDGRSSLYELFHEIGCQLLEPDGDPVDDWEYWAGHGLAEDLQDLLNSSSDRENRITLRNQIGLVPEVNNPLPLSLSEEVDYEKHMAMLLHQVVCGSLKLLRDELDKFRYVGPIRIKPERQHKAPAMPDESRWADGTAGWDLLIQDYDSRTQRGGDLAKRVSDWMSNEDKLDLGYRLNVTAHRVMSEQGRLMAELKLLKENYDDNDEEYFRTRIWPLIEAAETEARLELFDIRNDVPVGPSDVGIGIVQSVPVIVAALASAGGITAVEEPELHLHPDGQRRLGDLFIHQIKREKTFLIETHSEMLILRLLKRIRQTTDNELQDDSLSLTPNDVSVLYVERTDAGVKMTSLGIDAEGEFTQQWPGQYGFFEERNSELFE